MSHCAAVILSFHRLPLSLLSLSCFSCQACRFASRVLNRHKQQCGSNLQGRRVRQPVSKKKKDERKKNPKGVTNGADFKTASFREFLVQRPRVVGRGWGGVSPGRDRTRLAAAAQNLQRDASINDDERDAGCPPPTPPPPVRHQPLCDFFFTKLRKTLAQRDVSGCH